jgi:hypothetical protein
MEKELKRMSDSKTAYMSEHEIVQCYRKGNESAWKKVPRHFNPHVIGMPDHIIWNAGYDDAIGVMLKIARKPL